MLQKFQEGFGYLDHVEQLSRLNDTTWRPETIEDHLLLMMVSADHCQAVLDLARVKPVTRFFLCAHLLDAACTLLQAGIRPSTPLPFCDDTLLPFKKEYTYEHVEDARHDLRAGDLWYQKGQQYEAIERWCDAIRAFRTCTGWVIVDAEWVSTHSGSWPNF